MHPKAGLAQQRTIRRGNVEAIAIVQHDIGSDLDGALTAVKRKCIYNAASPEWRGHPDVGTGRGVGQTAA